MQPVRRSYHGVSRALGYPMTFSMLDCLKYWWFYFPKTRFFEEIWQPEHQSLLNNSTYVEFVSRTNIQGERGKRRNHDILKSIIRINQKRLYGGRCKERVKKKKNFRRYRGGGKKRRVYGSEKKKREKSSSWAFHFLVFWGSFFRLFTWQHQSWRQYAVKKRMYEHVSHLVMRRWRV